MYEEIFNQIRSAANKRNLKDSTIHAYCTSVAHFLNHTVKDIDALTTDDVDIFLTEKKLSGISPETYNHYHSGIRFFYKKVLKMNWDDDDIHDRYRICVCRNDIVPPVISGVKRIF